MRPRKLTDAQVRELRAWAAYATNMMKAAQRLGVSYQTVRRVLDHECYKVPRGAR